jgi:uncharacterized protein (DUF2141 family)
MKAVQFRQGDIRLPHATARTLGLAALLLVVAMTAPAVAQTASANLIRVNVEGLRSDKGQVMCALFSSAKDFPKNGDRAVAHAQSGIAHGKAVCEFSDVAPGRYAVSVFHDENSNGKMDTNFIGVPREGVGASNNAIGHFGPPKFDAAAFSYSGGQLELAITLVYL